MARAAATAAPPRARVRRAAPERILEAAFTCFSRYGYKRVSLETIAQEAGISRAALYLSFRNKEDLFRALARQILEQAQQAAAAAAECDAPLTEKLYAVLDAKLGCVYERIHDSPHAAEILDENNRLSGDLMDEFRRRFLRVLRACLARADASGEIDLRGAGLDAGGAAELLADAAKGLERPAAGAAADPRRFRSRMQRLVELTVAGLAPRGRRAARRRS
ncbi:MAG TPA: helix-turn-helix domain-containing protein [Myxococcota bacterium]|nr:helix-turn-helix domain-containing protein [Myxococcota bacterium]